MQLSSRILTALAVLILAVAVVAVRAGSPGTVQAATGDIGVLNVGTCYTTDDDAFGVADCDDGDTNSEEDGNEGYDVAGRDSITEVDNVFATYAIDPKTSGDQPRAILKNADLIKISIDDKGRDKRTGKIYAVSTGGQDPNTQFGGCLNEGQTNEIIAALGQTAQDLVEEGLIVMCDDGANGGTEALRVKLSDVAYFVRSDVTGSSNDITSSGDAQFRLTGTNSTMNTRWRRMAMFMWFGTDDRPKLTTSANVFAGLTSATYIDRDEDFSPGEQGTRLPRGCA